MFKSRISIFILFVFLLTGCGQAAITKPDSNNDSTPSTQMVENEEKDLGTRPTSGLIEKEAQEEEAVKEEKKEAELPEHASKKAPSDLSNESLSWYLRPNLNHTTPGIPNNAPQMLTDYDGLFVLPDNNKIYLTFDEGYELGYTPVILDILNEHNVKATFFITGHYLKSQPDLVKRMVNEGHMVANHTVNHPNLATLTPEKLQAEIMQLDQDFKALTGASMGKYIRPPAGNYSEASLKATKEIGYKTVFWSLAFNDWDPDNQPGRDYSYKYVTDHVHPGAIILLHAVSESNTQALADIIVDLQKEGYVFALLN